MGIVGWNFAVGNDSNEHSTNSILVVFDINAGARLSVVVDSSKQSRSVFTLINEHTKPQFWFFDRLVRRRK